MEKSVKRKLPENEENSRKTTKLLGEENAGAVSVKDADVDEFFAILQRIHVAHKYFQAEDSGGKRPEKTRKRWRPSLECKDFEENDDDVNEKGRVKDAVTVTEENLLLDLNVDPVTQDNLL